jgi:hypothetical protein
LTTATKEVVGIAAAAAATECTDAFDESTEGCPVPENIKCCNENDKDDEHHNDGNQPGVRHSTGRRIWWWGHVGEPYFLSGDGIVVVARDVSRYNGSRDRSEGGNKSFEDHQDHGVHDKGAIHVYQTSEA